MRDALEMKHGNVSADRPMAEATRARRSRFDSDVAAGPRRSASSNRHPFAAPDRERIAISTLGKIIKRGWDWLGLARTSAG
jgi:hypothetical protein